MREALATLVATAERMATLERRQARRLLRQLWPSVERLQADAADLDSWSDFASFQARRIRFALNGLADVGPSMPMNAADYLDVAREAASQLAEHAAAIADVRTDPQPA